MALHPSRDSLVVTWGEEHLVLSCSLCNALTGLCIPDCRISYAKAVYTNQPKPTLPVLRKGDKGKNVKALQQLLLANGIKLPKYGADSDFGEETEAGVIAFQKAVGIEADGVAGHDTMSKLLGVQ